MDERAPDGLVKLASAPRPDRAAKAKRAAAALVAYARELPFPKDLSAEEKCRRVAAETERIQKLDGSQLKLLIAELRETFGLDPDPRDSLPFTEQQAEQASRLFHYTGRRRGSHADCMIASCAILNGQPLASRNLADFQRFVPHGLKFEPVPTLPEEG